MLFHLSITTIPRRFATSLLLDLADTLNPLIVPTQKPG